MTVNKIDSNITGLAYAEESELGVLPGSGGADAVWRSVEPNGYNDFGGDIATVARNPINPSRQRRKGTTTDLDASVGFGHDFLQNAMTRLLQSFFFAAAREKPDTMPINGTLIDMSSATTTTFVAPAGLDTRGFRANHIVLSSGWSAAQNNGLKVLSAASGTTLTTTGNVNEAMPPSAARIQAVGIAFPEDDLTLGVLGTTGFILQTAAVDLTEFDFTPGEWLFIGYGPSAETHSFADNAPGYARLSQISGNRLYFDQATFTPVDDDGVGKTIRIFFGTVLRNEKDPELIVKRSLQWERQLGSDGDDPDQQAEYVRGAVGNELTLNMAKADKLAIDMSYVGIDVQHRTSADGPKIGARVGATSEDPFNTSSDLYRVRMHIVNPNDIYNAPLFGYIDESTVTIQNGVTPDKALGKLGAFDVSAGDFMAGGSVTAYFTKVAAIAAIRDNADVGINYIFAKQNAGFIVDLPLIGLGGGRANVEKDQPIKLPLEVAAYENPNGYTAMYVNFPYLPDVAMPAAD